MKAIKKLNNNELEVILNNDEKKIIASTYLRKSCPCAKCNEDRNSNKTQSEKVIVGSLKIIDSSIDDSVRIEKIWAIGNYAVGVLWGDGHDDGIFSYGLLEKLATT